MSALRRRAALATLLLAAAGSLVGPAAADPPPPGVRVAGTGWQLDGQPFVPQGFSMIGLLRPDGCTSTEGSGKRARTAFGAAELVAARDQWHANTVRFQLSNRGLDPQDPIFQAAYVQRVLDGVALARGLGLVVVLSMQDQAIGCGSAHPMPFPATERAWATIAPHVATDPYVVLELYNEPRNPSTAAGWTQWLDGGPTPTDNLGEPVVGHQALVDQLRALGSTNVLIADGANAAGQLQGIPMLADPLGQLAYAVHPYYFKVSNVSTLATDTANWDLRFGYLTATAPVIATEWNAGAASCTTGAAARVPDLLAYLETKGIPLLAQAFDLPTTMVTDLTTWTPTSMAGYGCGVVGPNAGELVQAHFAP